MIAPALPKRVQYQRNVRLPEGAKYVGRPSRGGNPFRVVIHTSRNAAVAEVVTRFALYLESRPDLLAWGRRELVGRDLACWCRVEDPFCHADVWLQEVNPAEGSLALHRRAEYWMGVVDCLSSADPGLLAAARRRAARWERAAFEAIPLDRPRTRGVIAISVGALLAKGGAAAEAREWIERCFSDDTVPAWTDQELRELLSKEAS